MLMHAHGHTISDKPGRKAASLLDLAQREYDRERLVLGRGDTTWLCGDFGFDGMLAQPRVIRFTSGHHLERSTRPAI